MTVRNLLLAAGSVVSLTAFLTVSPLMETEVEAQMFYGKVGPVICAKNARVIDLEGKALTVIDD